MTQHSLGRGTVAVPDSFIEAIAPGLLTALAEVRERNRTAGKSQQQRSEQNTLQGMVFTLQAYWQVIFQFTS